MSALPPLTDLSEKIVDGTGDLHSELLEQYGDDG
jgi:hypothetical protein